MGCLVFLGGEEVKEGGMGMLLLLEVEEEMEGRMVVEFGEGVVEKMGYGWPKERGGGSLLFSVGCRKQGRRRRSK